MEKERIEEQTEEEEVVLTEEEKKEKIENVKKLAPIGAGIDILGIQPTKISRDLRGKYICLYGGPKVGKTTFGVNAPKSLLLAFERGYNAIPNAQAIDIRTWGELKQVVGQLNNPAAKEKYHTIVFDTMGIASELCENYICAQNGVTHIGDIPYGAGWAKPPKEMALILRQIAMMGYGVILLCHAKEQVVMAEGEDPVTYVSPDLPNKRIAGVINRFVDLTGYIGVDFAPNGESVRTLFTRSTRTIVAGSRFPHLPEKIPFGYRRLVEALADAIEKSAEIDNAVLTDSPDTPIERGTRPFSETMKEAHELWQTLITFDKVNNGPLMVEFVRKVFGKVIRLSDATPDQQDLVELVLDDMRDLLQKQ